MSQQHLLTCIGSFLRFFWHNITKCNPNLDQNVWNDTKLLIHPNLSWDVLMFKISISNQMFIKTWKLTTKNGNFNIGHFNSYAIDQWLVLDDFIWPFFAQDITYKFNYENKCIWIVSNSTK